MLKKSKEKHIKSSLKHACKRDYIYSSKKGPLLLVKIKQTNVQQKSDYKSIASTPGMPTLKKNLDNKDIPMIDKLRNSPHLSYHDKYFKSYHNITVF